MKSRRRMIGLAGLLLTAAAPPMTSACVEDDPFGSSSGCRAAGEFCMSDSVCCSGRCSPTNLVDPSGECT